MYLLKFSFLYSYHAVTKKLSYLNIIFFLRSSYIYLTKYSSLSETRTSNYREILAKVPCVFETERAARCRADAGARPRPRERKRALDAWEQTKKIERSEERNVKNARSQRENGRERYIEKWRETPVRGSSAVIEGWPAILRVFPPPMAVALPTDALPPLPSTSLPISHLSKVPLVLFLFLPSSHPFCHRVDVNSRVQILARSKFRTGN